MPDTAHMVAAKPEVLFVCVHNAGRSQMAAALLAHHAGDRVVVRSAGTAPADAINPAVVEAMAELGIDLHANGAHPKRLDDAAVQASDVVITMGCGDECPFYPGKRYLDWALDDPAGQGVDAVRPIRDEIDRRVQALRRRPLLRSRLKQGGRSCKAPISSRSLSISSTSSGAPQRRSSASSPARSGARPSNGSSPTPSSNSSPPPRSRPSCRCSPNASHGTDSVPSASWKARYLPRRPGVLFLCVHNAGRSQMAAGWLRHLGGDRVTVYSGGSEPASADQPGRHRGDGEVGIDITERVPQAVDRRGRPRRRCGHHDGVRRRVPALSRQTLRGLGARRPAGQDIAAVRLIRDDIRQRVEALLASLGVAAI